VNTIHPECQEAYYRFIFEDFNNVDSRSAELCLKCIKAEAWKVISDFPATKIPKNRASFFPAI
jgi:hypothetical protein